MDDGSSFIAGVITTALIGLLMFLTINTSVPYADVHHGIELCKVNGGLISVGEDKMFERVINCSNGAIYTYTDREWDETFNKGKTP